MSAYDDLLERADDGDRRLLEVFKELAASIDRRLVAVEAAAGLVAELAVGSAGRAALAAETPAAARAAIGANGADAVIAGRDDTGPQSSPSNLAIVASFNAHLRTDKTNGLQAAVAASRITSSYGTRIFVAGSVNTDMTGGFDCTALANRYCEVNGERSLIAGSLLCRTFGPEGFQDYAGRWNTTHPQGPFYLTGRSSSATGNTFPTFYTVLLACTSTEIRQGSGHGALACRGIANTGGNDFWTVSPIVIGGSGNAGVAVRNGGSLWGSSNTGLSADKPTIAENVSLSTVLASDEGALAGVAYSAIIASAMSTIVADASGCQSNWSLGSSGGRVRNKTGQSTKSAGIASTLESAACGSYSVLLASRGAELVSDYVIAGGYSTAALAADQQSNKNLTWRIASQTGAAHFNGGASSSGADVAELRELLVHGAPMAPGEIVVREPGGRRVRPGRPGDPAKLILGVVSAAPSLVGNADDLGWAGRHLRDVWGQLVTVEVRMVTWPERRDEANERVTRAGFDGPVARAVALGLDIPLDAFERVERAPVTNPAYDPTRAHVRRADRPDEWVMVGQLGQLPVRIGPDAEADWWLGPCGERSAEPTRILLEEIMEPYDAARGYGLGWAQVG